MASSLGLRITWFKTVLSLMCQMQSKLVLRKFRWKKICIFTFKSYMNHIKGNSLTHRFDLDFKLHISCVVFSPSESLWLRLRTTWRSWVRIWRPQSSCAVLCSRATRSTALTSSARQQRSNSCRPATQTLPISWRRGENQISHISLYWK